MQNKSASFSSLPGQRAPYLVRDVPRRLLRAASRLRESSRAPALFASAQFQRAGTAGALVCGRFREIVYRHSGRRDRDRAVRHLESRGRSRFFRRGDPDRSAETSLREHRVRSRRPELGSARPRDQSGLRRHGAARLSSQLAHATFFSRTTANRNVPQVRVDPATLPSAFSTNLPLARAGRCHAPLRESAGGKNPTAFSTPRRSFACSAKRFGCNG